jgi:hypothetical protein
MKLKERSIDDLHLLAIDGCCSAAMIRRLNRRYREHVLYLARVIRRRAGRRRRP